ncbi:MAG: replication-associated recombination protein A [Proteobacteria bacterium]|nr:replication-associated recombination protein A [Pseudomonadota bacterium]
MKNQQQPLADLIRPESLSDLIGQDHLIGDAGILSLISESKNIPSMILWGPPGVGKTTIAKSLAKISDAEFVALSAINSGVAEVRKVIEHAARLAHNNRQAELVEAPAKSGKTLLMIDEIHHFNKTQQDLFLPAIEDGTITLIGTTTENPSFQLNAALLSRCKVVTLKMLDEVALAKILKRAEKVLKKELPLTEDGREALIDLACGDARYLLNVCEILFSLATKEKISSEKLLKIISKRAAHFDKKGDFHFNLISAFHKSLRGSDVDAALYYLARMLEAKEDPYYILRRLARFATEDIGLADPNALLQVMAAKENYDFLGSPEGDYALSHATIYCATSPKSNASYLAHKAAISEASRTSHLLPPKNILNAPTKMMKEQGFGDGYIYDHDTPDCFSGQEFFPAELSRQKFYEPNERGFERDLQKRLKYWSELRKKLR